MHIDENTALTIRTLNDVIANNDAWIAKSAAIVGGAFAVSWALAEHTDRMIGAFSGVVTLAAAACILVYALIVWRTLVENGELRARRRQLLNMVPSGHAPMSLESVSNKVSLALLTRDSELNRYARPVRSTAAVSDDSATMDTPR